MAWVWEQANRLFLLGLKSGLFGVSRVGPPNSF